MPVPDWRDWSTVKKYWLTITHNVHIKCRQFLCRHLLATFLCWWQMLPMSFAVSDTRYWQVWTGSNDYLKHNMSELVLGIVNKKPSPTGRCRTYLERSAAARHVCTLAACFSQSSEDAPLQTLLSVTPSSVFVVPVKWLVIIGHVNRSFYLLTYWTTALIIKACSF